MSSKMKKTYFGIFIIIVLLQACATTAKIKDGKTAFQYKNYEKAVELLPKDFQKAKNNNEKAKIANNIFTSYQYLQNNEKMLEWSDKLVQLNAENAVETKLQALKANGQNTEALQFLQDYLQKNKEETYKYKNELQKLTSIIETQQDSTFRVINLKDLNSSASDYDFFIASDNQAFFTSNRQGKNKDVFTTNSFSQVYTATIISDSTFSNIQPFKMNDFPYHFAQIIFNKDQTEAYFTQCGSAENTKNDYCKIYLSRFFNAAWTTPKPLIFFNDSTDEAQPFLSPDDKELYFTSNEKEGYGGTDIYVSKRDLNGNFSTAYNLGHKINSPANESFPTIMDSILYFSSDRAGGYGGLDIYKATKNGSFYENVVLMPYEINSGADDFYVFYKDTTKIYVSSARKGSAGKDDIFLVMSTPKIEEIVEKEPMFLLQVDVQENVYKQVDNPNSAIIGTQPVADASVFIPFPISKEFLLTDTKGQIKQLIFSPADFKMNVFKDGYLSANVLVDLESIDTKGKDTVVIQKNVLLQKIYKNVEIVLNNIYYDYDKANIREDAKINLDTLVMILKNNPSIKIELASHTDCRGADVYNLKLSQQRAESVVNYLIEKGIETSRLVAKGYGETQLLEKCECSKCTEEQHQRNRRTTFKIIE